MASKPERIVIDTNIFISFLISDSYARLDKYFLEKNVKLLISEESMAEFISVVQRPRFKKYFSEKILVELFETFIDQAELIKVQSQLDICRDQKDNFLLALCMDGKADYLITGDKDLLVLKTIKKTRILKLSDFLKK